MLRTGKVTPEKNSGLKLAQVMSTRTPLQAFQLLRMGHPIDVMAGYYEDQGILESDFYMMDRIQKLHALARYKEIAAAAKTDIDQFNAKEAAAQADRDIKAAEEKRQAEILEAAQKLVKLKQLNKIVKQGVLTTERRVGGEIQSRTTGGFDQQEQQLKLQEKLKAENPLEYERRQAFGFMDELQKIMSGGM